MLTLNIVLLVCALLLSAFFSSSETAILTMNRFKLDHLERRGDRKAPLLKQLRLFPDRFLATVLVGNTIVNAAAASIATLLFAMVLGQSQEAMFIATATASIVLLLFGEITPKTIATRHPERLGHIYFYAIRMVMWLLSPIVFVVTKVSHGLLRGLGINPAQISDRLSEEEFRSLMKVGVEEGAIGQAKKRMLASIFEISDKTVKEVMIPRTMVTMVEASMEGVKLLEAVVQSGFSRVPVYGGEPDNILGIVHAKDLLGLLQKGEPPDVTKILRKPFFIPESARVEKALNEFQKARVHMGFVVDEYGGVEGIVTIEDLLEEIVGEIQDEHDEETDYIRVQPDGSRLIDGGTAIYKINERLGIGLPEEEEFSTLAGFVIAILGHIPKEREEVEFKGHRLVVEKVLKRKVTLIRMISPASTPLGESPETGHERSSVADPLL
ncbi:MAG: hemolysin family protein [Acidobacteriota bacterium]